MSYKKYIEDLKKAWTGKKVLFGEKTYTVIDVDYNGALLIDRPAMFTETTAVGISMIKEV